MATPPERWTQSEPVDPTAAAREGFSAFSKNYGGMLKAWAVPALVGLAGTLLLRLYLSAQGIDAALFETWNPGEPLPLSFEQQMAVLGVGLPLYFLGVVASFVGWGLVARVVSRHASPDRELPPMPWGAFVGLGAALVLLYTVGLLLFVVPFLIFFHWFLYAPAVLATRGGTVGEAFEASRRFAKERRTMGFTALVLFVWFGVLVMGGVINSILAAVLASAGLPQAWAADLASPVGAWLLMPVMAALPAAFWVLGQKPQQPPAPEITPEQAARSATERFRTTKCPQCATLVPYTATGQPVDVTCPVCGRAGRVL